MSYRIKARPVSVTGKLSGKFYRKQKEAESKKAKDINRMSKPAMRKAGFYRF